MSALVKQLSERLEQLPLEAKLGGLQLSVLSVQYVPPGPNWRVEPHKHSFYEFHYITEGKGYVRMGETEFTVGAGMIYLTGPEVVHSQITDKSEPMAELCLHCKITLNEDADPVERQEAEQLLSILDTPVYSAVTDDFGAIPAILNCAREASDRLVGYLSAIRNGMGNILVNTARALAKNQLRARYAAPAKERGFRFVHESILYLEDNYQYPITLDDVADHIHFSARHLGRLFKAVTGKTVNQFLTDIRMDRAKRLLRETDYSLERIAGEIGFANGSYFSLLFKRLYGCTPGEYRALTNPPAGGSGPPERHESGRPDRSSPPGWRTAVLQSVTIR